MSFGNRNITSEPWYCITKFNAVVKVEKRTGSVCNDAVCCDLQENYPMTKGKENNKSTSPNRFVKGGEETHSREAGVVITISTLLWFDGNTIQNNSVNQERVGPTRKTRREAA
uniref:Uncharacterized protein n=1 Tax=Oryza punctata TaxID=4537 RepID=A0A0E0M119_ORYPU